MYEFFYFTSCSILLLVAETLLRAAGLSLPFLGFFFVAAAAVVSPRMAFCFALISGISMDFVMGCFPPWTGLFLALLTVPAILMHGKRPASDVLEFLTGAAIPPVMAVPHLWSVLTTPEAFASLLMSCLAGAVVYPLMLALVSRSALRLKLGADGGNGGS